MIAKITLRMIPFVLLAVFMSFQNHTGNARQMTQVHVDVIRWHIDDFMKSQIGMSKEGEAQLDASSMQMVQQYVESTSANGKTDEITVTWNVRPVKNEFVVEQVEMTGSSSKLISFFVRFWNTEMNLNGESTAECSYLEDSAKLNVTGETAKLTVTNTQAQ